MVELLPHLDTAHLATDIPLFHAMVRAHVAADRRAAFAGAIRHLGRRRRLLHVPSEIPPADAPYDRTAHLLVLHDSAGPQRDLALAEGHGRWIRPLTQPR